MKSLRHSVPLLGTALCLLFACQTDRSASDADLRTWERLLIRADSFPDRALPLADSTIALVHDRKLSDTAYFRPWMVKAGALARSGDVISARQLLDSCMNLAESDKEWSILGRLALLSSNYADQDNDGNPGSRTDRIGRYRTAVLAFDKADMPLDKAMALTRLGLWLNLKSAPWAVDTMKAAMDILRREKGPEQELLGNAMRVGFHSYGLGNDAEGRYYCDLAIKGLLATADSPLAAPLIRLTASRMRQSQPDSALFFFALADQIDPGIRDTLNFYRSGKLERAIILMDKGQYDRARSALDSCLDFARREKRKPMQVRALSQLGECALRQQNPAAAGRYFQSAESVADELGNDQLRKAFFEQYLLYAQAVGDRRLASRLSDKLGRSSPAPEVGAKAEVPLARKPKSTGTVQDGGRPQNSRSKPAPSVAPTASAKSRPTVASATPIEGIPVAPSKVTETWMPKSVTNTLDRNPLLKIVLPPGLLLLTLAGWLLSRHTQRKRIRYFESYLRLLNEGRVYRNNVHGGTKASDKAGPGVNRKEWLMYRLESWLLTEKPYSVPSFTPADCADYLGIGIPMLDEIIRSHVEVDTWNYIRHLRTEDAIRLMRDPASRGLSLQSIRSSSGFKNMRDFRSTFRVSAGVAPGRYRAYCRAEMRKAAG